MENSLINEKELGGYLFLNNNLKDFNRKINSFFNENEVELKKKKIYLKKKVKRFTVFNHSILLKKLLNI